MMNLSSVTEDLLDLAYKLKSSLGGKIRIINFDREDNILVGTYKEENLNIKFSMAFNSGNFLKVKFYSEGSKENETCDFELFLKALSELEDINGNPIGYPNVFYTEEDVISYDWMFTLDKEKESLSEETPSLFERIANKMPKRR